MTQRFPDEIISRYDRWFETPFGKWADSVEKQLLQDLLGPGEAHTILDIGCGTGHFSIWLQQLGYQVTAIDKSLQMLQAAVAKAGDEVDFLPMAAEKLSFADDSFDKALIVTTLEFVDEPAQVLCEAVRVVKDSIVVGFLNRQSVLGVWRKLTGLFKKNTYSRASFFTPGQLARMLRKAAAANGKEAEISWLGALCLCQLLIKRPVRCPFRGFIGMRVNLRKL